MSNGQVEGVAVTGEQVKNLQDKTFTIVNPIPYYTDVPSFDDPEKKVRKLHLNVQLSNGDIGEYMPNKTSIRTIVAKAGMKLEAWVGFKGEFYTLSQRVGQGMKEVIYVK
jgi:hypothetical protein